jgi:hypothetical protein
MDHVSKEPCNIVPNNALSPKKHKALVRGMAYMRTTSFSVHRDTSDPSLDYYLIATDN